MENIADLFLLRKDITFLNFGSFGATPAPIFDAYQKWQRVLEAEPVQFIVFDGPGYLQTSREALAKYIGVADKDDLVFVTNPSFAVNMVAKNFPLYQQLFGNNFVSVANTLEDEKLTDIEDIIKKYLDPFKPTGTKPKDAKAQARSDKSKAALNAKLKDLLSDSEAEIIIKNSVSKEEAQSKIKQFLSK